MSRTLRPMRCVGVAVALSLFLGLAACGGGGGGGNQQPTATLASITLSSNSVAAGATLQGTATLDRAAGSGGATVSLTSSNASIATVPGSVLIAEGSQSANFTVTGVAAGGPITITGNFGGSRTANLTVNAAAIDLVSVSLAATSVNGPGPVTGTVTISSAAPSGGTTVGLSSSNTGAATVPSNVAISSGTTSANFTVNVTTASAQNITITATLGGTTRTASLGINAVSIVASFRVIPDAGSAASGEQCEVVKNPAGNANSLRCTFDAGASTPLGSITKFIWRFESPGGSTAFERNNSTLSGITLPCGSFGSSPPLGSAFSRNVTLEIQTPSGNDEETHMVTFIRNGPCG